MTISYSGSFARLLIRWKGSLWKSVWKELTVFLILFYAIRVVYLYALDDKQQEQFVFLAIVFNEYSANIPLTFLLGFYVTSIMKRWWEQFEWVAWPDDALSTLCALMPDDGKDEKARLKRHMVARYLILTAALAWRDVSVKVRTRFPTVEHLVSCGLMTDEEYALYKSQVENIRWFVPMQWAQNIVAESVAERKLSLPLASRFFAELNHYKLCCRKLYCYDWVTIPLVYTQVVTVATYCYFFCFCSLGRQVFEVKSHSEHHDLVWFPVFTLIQFFFYIGWFKVGQDLMRPFGTDDDDIELNYILDRHIQTAFTIVDSVIYQRPPLVEDRFWNKGSHLPHTKLSAKMLDHPPKLHAYVLLKRPEDGAQEEDCVGDPNDSDPAAPSAPHASQGKREKKTREERKRWRKF